MGMMELRRQIIAGARQSELPAGYTKLPYITADGNQSLRLNYTPVHNDEFHCKFTIATTAISSLISAGTGTYQLIVMSRSDYRGFYYKYFSSGGAKELSGAFASSTWYDLDIDKNGIATINEITATNPYVSALDGANTSLWLFQRRDGSGKYIGSMSEFWIMNGGEYKVKLIPCLRKRLIIYLIQLICGAGCRFDSLQDQVSQFVRSFSESPCFMVSGKT